MKFILALIFIVVLNTMFFFAGLAMNDTGLSEKSSLYNYDKSMMKDYSTNGYNIKQLETDDLPNTESSVSSSDGGLYTDVFQAIKKWVIGPFNIAKDYVNAFPNLMKMAFPDTDDIAIVFGLSFIWYVLALVTAIGFIRGN
jgi:hypothetical protein